jgi:hypothetical protein
LVAYPEIRSRCGEVPALQPLPPLAQDPALPAEDDVVLALVSPLAKTGAALEGTDPFDAGGARARIARAAAVPAGALAQIDLGLRGEACGDLGVRSALGWTDDGQALRLTTPTLPNGELERITKAPLAPDIFVRSLGAVRFPPPVAPDALRALVPALASSMSDPSVEVSAKIQDIKPLEVALRGDDVAASLLVRTSVTLKQR